jgi:hypothetical protein
MALTNIHEFVDDEIITAEDLNSIGESVNAEIINGGIESSSLVWPLIAQGDLDMNGYGIEGMSSFFGEFHVNTSQTLAEAITLVNSAGGGTIIIDDNTSSQSVASDRLITASNVSIIGASGEAVITVSSGASLYGIKVVGNYFRLEGCRITGGASGKPALIITDVESGNISNNTFVACEGPCILTEGGTEGMATTRISDNVFAYCEEEGIIVDTLLSSTISNNNFINVKGNAIELGSATGVFCLDVTISGNTFRKCGNGSEAGIFMYSPGLVTSNLGQITISGNVIDMSLGGKSLDLGKFTNCTLAGNTLQDPCTINLQRSTISGNAFNSTSAIDTTVGIFTGNNFRGAVTSAGTGTNNLFNGNYFEADFTVDSWIMSFVGNIMASTVTVTNDPAVVGLNWGY